MSADLPIITLKKGKEKSLERFHPWIFSGAIHELPDGLKEGDIVKLFSKNQQFLAIGYYQIGSIAVRILSFEEIQIDKSFWKKQLEQAIALRAIDGLWGGEDTNVFRLIHGEGDGFPGLIVDYYNGCVVFQAHTVGMYRIKETFLEILKEVMGNNLLSVYDKSK